MTTKYDVYAIGNALVDMEYEISDDFLEKFKIDKGLMTLVDESRQNELLDTLGGTPRKQQCGGSAANTVIAVSQFGAKAFYSCKVASDPIGNFYFQDLQDNGVDSNLKVQKRHSGTTGKCLVLISPDAERTMNTFLGITSTISKEEVIPEAIKNSKYMYMEGYLVASPTGKEAAILEMIGPKGVDLLFCNESEAFSFTQTQDIYEAREKLKAVSKTFVITRGENGAMIFDGVTFIEIEPYAVKAVDTNGAGDMYAGAFLFAITHNHSHASAGKLASLAASRVVGQFGPRLKWHETQEIRNHILGDA